MYSQQASLTGTWSDDRHEVRAVLEAPYVALLARRVLLDPIKLNRILPPVACGVYAEEFIEQERRNRVDV